VTKCQINIQAQVTLCREFSEGCDDLYLELF